METFDDGIVPTWTMGDRLRKARMLTKMSLTEFAAAALMSEKTINNYETDRVRPQPIRLEKWARVTGVSLEWIETGMKNPADTPAPEGRMPAERPRPVGGGLALVGAEMTSGHPISSGPLPFVRHVGLEPTTR